MEVPVPYAFTLTTTIPASPQEIYEAWLDSVVHSEMTGGEASMSDETGAQVSAWDGYITGRNLELVPGERIVQSWRTTQFTDEHEDSQIIVTLKAVDDGTLLTLEHTNVPDAQKSYEEGGWQEHYFDPMTEYFAKRKRPRTRRPAKGVARKTKAKRTGAGRTAGPAVRRAKPKRARAATRAKAKRVASKARRTVGKKATKRAAAAKSARPRAKKTRSKAARGKRR
jgi:uncharacterized protein YndB with AHSA1/START domain